VERKGENLVNSQNREMEFTGRSELIRGRGEKKNFYYSKTAYSGGPCGRWVTVFTGQKGGKAFNPQRPKKGRRGPLLPYLLNP